MNEGITLKTRSGVEFKISPEDLTSVSAQKWYVNKRGYVIRQDKSVRGVVKQVSLHRFIFGLTRDDNVIVDHINRDTLDNRRENLRICDKAQNGHNQGMQRTNTSGFKGVTRSSSGKWIAQIRCNGTRLHIGSFALRELAAHEYNKVALRLHGEFAVLNPVEGVYLESRIKGEKL